MGLFYFLIASLDIRWISRHLHNVVCCDLLAEGSADSPAW